MRCTVLGASVQVSNTSRLSSVAYLCHRVPSWCLCDLLPHPFSCLLPHTSFIHPLGIPVSPIILYWATLLPYLFSSFFPLPICFSSYHIHIGRTPPTLPLLGSLAKCSSLEATVIDQLVSATIFCLRYENLKICLLQLDEITALHFISEKMNTNLFNFLSLFFIITGSFGQVPYPQSSGSREQSILFENERRLLPLPGWGGYWRWKEMYASLHFCYVTLLPTKNMFKWNQCINRASLF